jgi:Catalase
MQRDGYLLYEPSVEQIQPGERETIQAILDSIGRTNETSFTKWHRGIRQQHAKANGFLKGELTVYNDLPEHLRQGMFAQARSYPIIIRLSSALGDIRSDRVRVARGFAIKVLGVEGARALPEDDSTNQDFLLVNHKNYFADAASYLTLQRSFELQPKLPDFVLRAVGLGARAVSGIFNLVRLTAPSSVRALADQGNNILGETFYSGAAIRFGNYIARLSLAPVSDSVRKLTGVPAHHEENAMHDFVADFFSNNTAEYELCAQLGKDLQRTPVEDADVEWRDEISPQQPLGRITLLPQQTDSPARRVYGDKILSFDPWRCLAAHQPLGSLMRLRREAYQASSVFRHGKDQTPMQEPQHIGEFPD